MPRRGGRPSHVVTGRVIKPHGVLGWVLIESLTTNPRRFQVGASFILEGEEESRLVLEEVREGSGGLLARFRGFEAREQAEGIKGRRLMVTPEEVGECPPDAYWEHQVIGLEVYTRDGRCLGAVVDLMETGANDVLVVEGEKEVLIPMIAEVVLRVDLEEGRMIIEPLPGLLED